MEEGAQGESGEEKGPPRQEGGGGGKGKRRLEEEDTAGRVFSGEHAAPSLVKGHHLRTSSPPVRTLKPSVWFGLIGPEAWQS